MKNFHKSYGVTKGTTDKEHMRNLGIIRDDHTLFHDACDAGKSNRVRVQPGKGDRNRIGDKDAFDMNYDSIRWN